MTEAKEFDSSLNDWALALTKQVGEEWKLHPELASRGFAVFYSAPKINPDLMIIGFNPAGEEGHFDFDGALKLPTDHDYFKSSYKLADEMKNVFAWNQALLRESVKLNLIFFASQNADTWNAMPESKRMALEKFCAKLVLEIIEKLKPKNIICEGIGTFDRLKNLLGFTEIDTPVRSEKGTQRILAFGKAQNYDVVGILHLSGAKGISQHDRETIKTELEKRFSAL